MSEVDAPGTSVNPSSSWDGMMDSSPAIGVEVPKAMDTVKSALVRDFSLGKVGVVEGSSVFGVKVPEDVGVLKRASVGDISPGVGELIPKSVPMEVKGIESFQHTQDFDPNLDNLVSPIERAMMMEQLEVLAELANLPDKERIKVQVVEVEDSLVEEDEEQKEEHRNALGHNLEPNDTPPINWDEVNMGMFCKMVEDGMQNFLSLVK